MADILIVHIYKTIVGILGILGNSLVCLIIWKVPVLHTRTNAFIVHQAAVDLIGCILIILKNEIPLPDYDSRFPDNTLGRLRCFIWSSEVIIFFVFATSTLNLLAVTMERYFAIVHPFLYQRIFTKNPRLKVGGIMGTCWLVSAVTYAFCLTLLKVEGGQCVSIPGAQVFGIIVVFSHFGAPVAAMLFAYTKTGMELKRGAARVGPGTGQGTGMAESLLKARRNTFKTLLLVFITFLVCWTPNQVLFLMFNFGFPLTYDKWYYIVSVAMMATNACVNPVIYSFKYRQFRQGVRQVFCGKKSRMETSAASSAANTTQG